MELAYNSSAWRSVDFSQWSPLGGHTEPGDIDLMLALKRLRHGSLRCVLLESSRISHHAFKELLTIQSQIEKLVIRSPPASARAFASAHQLKHLELLGPSTLLCAEAKRLETLVLHLPSLSDLQAIPKFKTLKMLEVFPPAISFSSHGQLTPPEPFKEALLQIFQSCKQLEHVRLWGIYNACDNLMLRALSHLDLQELHGYYLEAKPAKPALFCVLICAFDTFELTGCADDWEEDAVDLLLGAACAEAAELLKTAARPDASPIKPNDVRLVAEAKLGRPFEKLEGRAAKRRILTNKAPLPKAQKLSATNFFSDSKTANSKVAKPFDLDRH
eukprot:g24383.t1